MRSTLKLNAFSLFKSSMLHLCAKQEICTTIAIKKWRLSPAYFDSADIAEHVDTVFSHPAFLDWGRNTGHIDLQKMISTQQLPKEFLLELGRYDLQLLSLLRVKIDINQFCIGKLSSECEAYAVAALMNDDNLSMPDALACVKQRANAKDILR